MYINPVLVGVLATIMIAETAFIICLFWVSYRKK